MSYDSPISFRLSKHEIEVLQQEQKSDESLSLTAARLLREHLGLIDVDGKSTLNRQTLESLIKEIVIEQVESLSYGLDKAVYIEVDKLGKRINLIENKLEVKTKSTRKSTLKSTNIT